MKPFRFQPLVRRLALREWFSLTIAMTLLGLILGWQNGLGRGDQIIYDQFVSFDSRPARDDIIIVAIDDYSLAQLGRWPWPRKLHAALLDRLTTAGARRVGLDIILSEPERPQADGARPGDAALTEAIQRNERVVLPVVMSDNGAGMTATLPIADFANAASGLGHINMQHDEDGVVRSVFLLAGQNGLEWPQFSLALLESSRQTSPATHITLPVTDQEASNAALSNWQHIDRMHIPYAGNNGHFQTVPYVSVLRGEVPGAFFKGKIVLVGATGLGLSHGLAGQRQLAGHNGGRQLPELVRRFVDRPEGGIDRGCLVLPAMELAPPGSRHYVSRARIHPTGPGTAFAAGSGR